MKTKTIALAKVIPSVKTAITKKGFKIADIMISKDAASFAIQGQKFEKLFFQVLNLTVERPGFAIVEIYVSNLSYTEKWVDIEVSIDVLADFLGEMMKHAASELSHTVSLKELEGIAKKIEAMEPKLAASINELHHIEDQLNDPKTAAKNKAKLEAKLAKTENTCLKAETEVSRLAFRYFTNLIDSIEPFFHNALLTVNWSKQK